jgi:CMP-N-acetylneuraminic acid synthetase
MYNDKKFLCIIPARKGSTKVKNKNLKKFGHKTLVEHSIYWAKKSKNIDERFSFLANPRKIKSDKKDLTMDEQIDSQIEKILKDKESLQNKYSKML